MAEEIRRRGLDVALEVDGGIDRKTAATVVSAGANAVSYTHLDVYKRQGGRCPSAAGRKRFRLLRAAGSIQRRRSRRSSRSGTETEFN